MLTLASSYYELTAYPMHIAISSEASMCIHPYFLLKNITSIMYFEFQFMKHILIFLLDVQKFLVCYPLCQIIEPMATRVASGDKKKVLSI